MAFLTDLLQPKVPIEDITFLDKELDGMSEYDRGVVYDLLCKTTDGSEFISGDAEQKPESFQRPYPVLSLTLIL